MKKSIQVVRTSQPFDQIEYRNQTPVRPTQLKRSLQDPNMARLSIENDKMLALSPQNYYRNTANSCHLKRQQRISSSSGNLRPSSQKRTTNIRQPIPNNFTIGESATMATLVSPSLPLREKNIIFESATPKIKQSKKNIVMTISAPQNGRNQTKDAKPGQIVSNLQYYSNQSNGLRQSTEPIQQASYFSRRKESMDDSSDTPIINVSNGDSINKQFQNNLHHLQSIQSNNQPSNNLHESISFLTTQLKQLEGKYLSLANFYKQQRHNPSKKPGSAKKTPRTELRDQIKKDLNPLMNNFLGDQDIEKSMITEARTQRETVEEGIRSLIQVKKDSSLMQLLVGYKNRLGLDQDQAGIFDVMCADINFMAKPLSTAQLADFQLQSEYAMQELKQAVFQIRYLNEQSKLDIQKIKISLAQMPDQKIFSDVNQSLVQLMNKFQTQEPYQEGLKQFQDNMVARFEDLKAKVRSQHQSEDLVQENLRLKNQVQQQIKQFESLDNDNTNTMQAMDKTIHEYRQLNTELRKKIDFLSQDLNQKSLLLTQRENQKQELILKLQEKQVALTGREQKPGKHSEERWRQTADILASMTQTFLHSMRRLQKVVHKKEQNVNKEKADFESAKRDLEITLKTVQKQIEANQSGRISEQSEIPHKQQNKHSNSTESADKRPPSDKILSSKRVELLLSDYDALQKRLHSADALRQTTDSRILYQVKQTVAEVTLKQQSWSNQVEEQINWMAKRIECVCQMHAKAHQQLLEVTSQLEVSQQGKKVKDQELVVARAELVSVKADFKEKLRKAEGDLRLQNHKLQEQLSVQTAAADFKHQEAIKEIKIAATQNQLLVEKISTLDGLQTNYQSQMKQLEAQVKRAEQTQATSLSVQKQQHNESLKSIQAEWQSRLEQLQQSFKQMQEKNQSLEVKFDESARNLVKEKTKQQKSQAEIDALRQQIDVKEKELELLIKKHEKETFIGQQRASQKEEVLVQQVKDLQEKIQKLQTPEGNELVTQLNKQAMTKNEMLVQLKLELQKANLTARSVQKELDDAREAQETVKTKFEAAVQQLAKEQASVKSLTKDLKESKISGNQKREEEISSLTIQLVERNQALLEAKTSCDDWQQRHAQLQHLIEDKTTQFKEQVAELEASYKDLENQNQNQIKDLERQYQQSIKDLESQYMQNSTVMESSQRDSNKRVDSLKVKVGSLETKVQSLTQDRTDLETQLFELQNSFTQQVDDLKSQLSYLKGNRDGLKQKASDLQEENKCLQQKISEAELNIAQLSSLHEQDQQLLQTNKAELQKLTNSNQALLELYEAQTEDLKSSVAISKKKEQEGYQSIQQLKNQHQDQLKIQRESIQALTKENNQIKEILKTQGDHMEQLHQMQNESQAQIQDRFDEQESKLRQLKEEHKIQVKELEANQSRVVEEFEEKLVKSSNELQLTKEEAGQVIHKLQLAQQDQISKHAKQILDNDNLMQVRCVSLENLLKERKTELQACQSMLKNKTEINDTLHLQIEAKSEELIQVSEKLINAEKDAKRLVGKNQVIQTEKEKIAQDVQDLTNKVLELTNLNENHMAQIQDLEQQNEHSTATLEKNLLLIQQFKTQLQKSIVDNKAHKDQLIEITKQRDDLQSQNDSLCFFVLESNEQIKGLQQAVFNYQLKEQDTSVNIAPYLEANPRLSSIQASELETLGKENQTLKVENQTLRQQFQQMQQQLQDEQNNYQQQLVAQAKSSESQTSLLQQKIAKVTAAKEQEVLAAQNHSKTLQQMVSNLDTQLNDLGVELEAKNELLEEANNLIQDFNEEKHELKAKFKVIMSTLEDRSEVSSYKSTDEIDLNDCFEQLESALIQNQGRNQKMILDISQRNDELTARQQDQQAELERGSEELKQLREQLGDIQMRMLSQNQMVKQEMDKAEIKITKLKNKLKQAKENRQETEKKDASSFMTNNSLQAENVQLLDRLQKVEAALAKARSGAERNVDSDLSLQDFVGKVQSLRKQFITGYQDCIVEMRKQLASEISELQQAFLDDKVFQWGLQQDKLLNNWNGRAEQVAQVEFHGRTFLVIADKEAKMYIVAKDNISVETLSYLQTFVADNITLEARIPESLTRLVADLRQALLELQLEYNQYRSDIGLASVETSVVALKDDNEYLSGENRDLHLKVKEICMMNAQLKIQLQKLSEVQKKDDEGNVRAMIETARNLSEMDENEFREQTEFISDHDSFNDIVVRNDSLKAKIHLEQKVTDITQELESLREQLQHHEENKDDSTTIAHIKGTLMQFLKNTPVTEKQNEELLKIVYSMMDFSKSEVQEMTASRTALKLGNTKKNSNNGNSRSNTSNNSGEGLQTAEKRKTNWLGVFGLKKGSQNTSRQESGHISPVRPMKQNSQGNQ